MSDNEQIKAFRWLISDEGWHRQLDLCKTLPLTPNQILKLRQHIGISRATAMLSTAQVHSKAINKLGSDRVLATDRALQQATDHHLASYKADCFPQDALVIDVCCGIGGDSLALQRRGPLLAIDRDPAVCVLASHNLTHANPEAGRPSKPYSALVAAQSADHVPPPSKFYLHIDPDRRPGGKRVSDPNYGDPPADLIGHWMRASLGGAIKLAPAADIPGFWPAIRCRQWISRRGTCRQQVAWFGDLNSTTDSTQPLRKATTIADDLRVYHFFRRESELATVSWRSSGRPLEFIYDLDPAVRAAGLTAAFAESHDLECIESPSGFLTGSQAGVGYPLATSYKISWFGSRAEKVLRRELAKRSPASLTIKVRGIDVIPEQIRPRLLPRPGDGPPLTLFVGKTFAAISP